MNQEKSQIKNAAVEDMFLKVAPDHLVERYFDFFESDDPAIADRRQALATMFASKYSKQAFSELLAHYKKTTGRDFVLFEGSK